MPTAHIPVLIDAEKCIRCLICDLVCPGDIIYKDPTKDSLPVVRYPEECWYCGLCEQECPTDAIEIVFHPMMLNPTRTMADLIPQVDPANDP